jgi:hypothetical protein
LEKQAKVRPTQNNNRNMVNKFENGSNFTKRASQLLKRQQKGIEDEKIKYAKSAYLMQECLISRMALATRWVANTTLG